jgi:hypothetical protein
VALRPGAAARRRTAAWQERIARAVHVAFYIVVLGMVESGIGTMVLSGAALAIFGGSGTLPHFHQCSPRVPHGIGTFLLVGIKLGSRPFRPSQWAASSHVVDWHQSVTRQNVEFQGVTIGSAPEPRPIHIKKHGKLPDAFSPRSSK